MTTQHKDHNSEGVSYFLPRNDVRVVFTNTTIASEIKIATKALEGAKKIEAKATLALENAKKELNEADPKKLENVKKLEKLVADAKKAVAAASTKVANAEKDLEKKKGAKGQILIEVLPPVPDTSQLYVAELDHSTFNDDTVTFKVSAEGLLTQVTYKGEDRTGEIIQNLVETAIEAGKLYARLHGVPIPPTPKETQELIEPPSCTPKKSVEKEYYYEFTIDPSNPEEIAIVNRQLIETSLPFLLHIQAPAKNFTVPPNLGKSSVHGLLYRRPIPYTVSILEDRKQKELICRIIKEQKDGQEPELADQIKMIQMEVKQRAGRIPTSKSKQVLMTSGGPVAMLEFGDRPFVTTDLQATFKQGVLLDSSETRPSEVLGFSRIPLNIVREVGDAVGSIVTNLVQFKIDTTTKSKELVESETELLKAQQENSELQKEILELFESAGKSASETP